MKKTLLLFLLSTAVLRAVAQRPSEQALQHGPELQADSVIFPLTLVDAFPFVSVAVNGVKGKFMFDTGNKATLKSMTTW